MPLTKICTDADSPNGCSRNAKQSLSLSTQRYSIGTATLITSPQIKWLRNSDSKSDISIDQTTVTNTATTFLKVLTPPLMPLQGKHQSQNIATVRQLKNHLQKSKRKQFSQRANPRKQQNPEENNRNKVLRQNKKPFPQIGFTGTVFFVILILLKPAFQVADKYALSCRADFREFPPQRACCRKSVPRSASPNQEKFRALPKACESTRGAGSARV